MRFLADGPSIPDNLLLARDQGRVIFFCGAGVSRAYAKLPDFFGLANKVIKRLVIDENDPSYKLMQEAGKIEGNVGIPGVISADSIFGYLERDFTKRDIEEAVASALKPPAHCDLTAHKILLDLATTPEGNVQLVTTNFDRLFDDCGRKLQVWQPPRLPNPSLPNEINGIIYLHGRSTPNYKAAENGGFVLSSSDFGRAYLSDGWATNFIRGIFQDYVVVFVGYSADDPPVRYLLEALHKTSGNKINAYAFQSGDYDDAIARWHHKGVEAIPYSPDDGHKALWDSLGAWAERARDPDAWVTKVINASQKGPTVLQPHERGQVAHIISTYEGAKMFCEAEVVPPAEWLCVFDKYRRFASPDDPTILTINNDEAYIDPFDLYGLDSDPQPTKSNPEGYFYTTRETPTTAWDAFELNRLDKVTFCSKNLTAFRGHLANHFPHAVPRIEKLGEWLAKVCDQPVALWWASHQSSLNQHIQRLISNELMRSDRPIDQNIRNAWRQLFEAWKHCENFYEEWNALQSVIKIDGWSNAIVRRFGEVLRPRLSVSPPFRNNPNFFEAKANQKNKSSLLRMDVKYPGTHKIITVPNEWCSAMIRGLRQNLELALALEQEVGDYRLLYINAWLKDNDENIDDNQITSGLSSLVIQFAKLFKQLVQTNKSAAKLEFLSLPTKDDTIFARLRILASADECIVSENQFGQFISSLSDTAFWDRYHQRDLLLIIAERWEKLDDTSRDLIEQKLLKGPKQRLGENTVDFNKRRALSILNRLQWLKNKKYKLSASICEQIQLLRSAAPDWKEVNGESAADSLSSSADWGETDTSYEELEKIPISQILQQAKKNSGRSDDFVVEKDPFSGLATEKPVRALAALTHAAKQNDFPDWAWQRFLASEAREKDKAKLTWLIAEQLISYPNAQLKTIFRPSAKWLRNASTKLSKDCLPVFDHILNKLIDVLREAPKEDVTGIVRDFEKPDWVEEVFYSPIGEVLDALFNDPRKDGLKQNQGIPSEWLVHAEALLALPKDLRRYAIVVFFYNINYFFHVDPKWTEDHLLPALRGDDQDDRDAAWSGFLRRFRLPNKKLYMQLKSDMLEFAVTPPLSLSLYSKIIASIVLGGWKDLDSTTGERCISNDEMHNLLLKTDDKFRSRILWQAQQWFKAEDVKTSSSWKKQLPKLLQIWPRNLSIRSSNTSAWFCTLAFSSKEQFPTIAALVLPLLSKIELDCLTLSSFTKPADDIIDQHPEKVLELIYAVLPDNALAWPYEMEEILQRIEKADDKLKQDNRLISLKRQWNSR